MKKKVVSTLAHIEGILKLEILPQQGGSNDLEIDDRLGCYSNSTILIKGGGGS